MLAYFMSVWKIKYYIHIKTPLNYFWFHTLINSICLRCKEIAAETTTEMLHEAIERLPPSSIRFSCRLSDIFLLHCSNERSWHYCLLDFLQVLHLLDRSSQLHLYCLISHTVSQAGKLQIINSEDVHNEQTSSKHRTRLTAIMCVCMHNIKHTLGLNTADIGLKRV